MSRPYASILPPTEGAVLVVLAGTTKPLSGRDLARISGVSPNGAWKALRRLSEHGVVKEQAGGGRATLYTLNRNHLASDAILTLTRLRIVLIDRLKEQLGTWPIQPLHASIFGSVARGDGGPASDVDIFVVRPRAVIEDDVQWRSQIDALSDAILAWTGNPASVSEITGSDIRRLRMEQPKIVDSVIREGILLVGESATHMLIKRK